MIPRTILSSVDWLMLLMVVDFAIHFEIDKEHGSSTILIGENGTGKSSMLQTVLEISFLLWTHGCVIHPELSGTNNYYKGSRGIPAPLLVRRFVGNSSGDTLAKEILMLTKMNWNSGDSLYKSLPVTLGFAKILARMSKQEEAIFDKPYDFRYFM